MELIFTQEVGTLKIGSNLQIIVPAVGRFTATLNRNLLFQDTITNLRKKASEHGLKDHDMTFKRQMCGPVQFKLVICLTHLEEEIDLQLYALSPTEFAQVGGKVNGDHVYWGCRQDVDHLNSLP